MEQAIHLKGENGIRLGLASGMLEYGHPNRWSTPHFYHAFSGDRIELRDTEKYEFAVATYSLDRPEEYIYTYSYQPEENWAIYRKDLTTESYRLQDYVFAEECFFRVNVKKKDEQQLLQQDQEIIENALIFFCMHSGERGTNPVFAEEIEETAKAVNALPGKKFLLLTDSHYTVNGTWEDTVSNMKKVAELAKLDGVIHLGDFTDGMVKKSVNREYVDRMLSDLGSIGELPLYVALGNHDSNYFRSNPEPFSEEEQFGLYLQDIYNREKKAPGETPALYYRIDFADIRLRCFFLHSHDYREKKRYGFSDRETGWFEEELYRTPEHYRVIVFSHVPPLPEIHYWSKEIRNGEKLVQMLEEFQEKTHKRVLAWIHGHNHADAVYKGRSFPIVSIGCNKLEYFTDKKPEGSVTYERRAGTVSQDLWDVLVIPGEKDELRFVRFGAGEDRIV
jgi:predicted phosphodiesterase